MLFSYVQEHLSWDEMREQVDCIMRTAKTRRKGETLFVENFGREHCVSRAEYQHPIQNDMLPGTAVKDLKKCMKIIKNVLRPLIKNLKTTCPEDGLFLTSGQNLETQLRSIECSPGIQCKIST